MKSLKIYQVISYILLPFGAFMGMCALFTLLLTLGNVILLFPVFLMGGTAVYIFASFNFLQNGLLRNQSLKHSFKDWIKVNGIVTLVFTALGITQAIILIAMPELLRESFDSMSKMMPVSQQISPASMAKIQSGTNYALLILFILLTFHLISTFRLIKKYQHIFNL